MARILTIYKDIKKSDKKEDTHVKFTLYYEKGIYYVVSTPVTKTKEEGYSTESFEAYRGFRENIHKVTRRSQKQSDIAESMLLERIEEQYCNWYKKNNIEW